jgi:hypothetical protein
VPRVGGAVVADPTGVGDALPGVAEGLALCDGLGDRVGAGEVRVGVGVGVGAVGEGLVVDWVAPADAGTGPGLTRM